MNAITSKESAASFLREVFRMSAKACDDMYTHQAAFQIRRLSSPKAMVNGTFVKPTAGFKAATYTTGIDKLYDN